VYGLQAGEFATTSASNNMVKDIDEDHRAVDWAKPTRQPRHLRVASPK
jgi:hypothetical protein